MIDYFAKYLQEKSRAERAERALEVKFGDHANLAKHLGDVELLNKVLKAQVRGMQVKAEEFNNLLYATGLIVHCTGCLPGAPANYEDLTEEKVKQVECIAGRLRVWWTNNRRRIGRSESTNSASK